MATAANHAHVIEPAPELKTKVGEHLVVQLEGSDPDPGDEANLTWGLIYGPTGLCISESGLLDWTPISIYSGYQTFQVSLSDGKSMTTNTYVITVEKADKKEPNTTLVMLQQFGVWLALGGLFILAFFMKLKFGFRRRPLWVLFGPKE